MEVNAEEQQPAQTDALKTETIEMQSLLSEEFSEDVAVDFDATEGDDSFDYRFQSNRGGFRGRGATSPRFRGRGFGPSHQINSPPMRGNRGGGNPTFFRGSRGGNIGAQTRFNSPNFEPSWGPPPMFGAPPPMAFGHQQQQQQQQQQQHQDLWVETKTEDGKSYYYHAATRETTWTRPEGPNVKIMAQNEVEAMQSAKNQQLQSPSQQQTVPKSDHTGENAQINGDGKFNAGNGNAASSENELNGKTAGIRGDANDPQTAKSPLAAFSEPFADQPSPFGSDPKPFRNNIGQQMPPPFNTPPPFAYGMPPPGYMQYPPGTWPMPWQQPATQPIGSDMPAKSLISKPGVIEPQVIARAAEWSEHRAPDGRPYYYNASRGESVWEKPQAIRDLEAARMAAHSGVATSFPPPLLGNPGMMPPMGPMHVDAFRRNDSGEKENEGKDGFPFHGYQRGAPGISKISKSSEGPGGNLLSPSKDSADSKKKDDEEKAKQIVAKQQDKSRPVSSTPIAGTPWCVVWTGDGRVFFYNPSTRTSVWERPEDLVGRADVDKAIAATPDQVPPPQASNSATPTSDDKSKTTTAPHSITEDASVKLAIKRSESESSGENEDVPSKKLKTNENTAAVTAIVTSKLLERKQDIGKEAAIEAEVRAARERALVPLETRVISFKEMLKEKDVSAFSTWEKELHKIVFDPRYLLLTSRERKQVFEKYVKERAEEERREKRNKMRQKREDFRSLMESANLHGKSSFSDFAQKHGKEDRFKGIEKMRDREGLFNEYILEVRRREKDEKVQKKETIRKEFIALLREHTEIDRHSRWPDVKKRIDSDGRYRAVETSVLREDYFHDYCKILKEERRKQKDKERDRKERKEKEKREHRDRDRQKDKGKDGKTKDKREKRDEGKESGERESGSRDDSSKPSKRKYSSDKDEHDQEDGEHPPSSEDESERQQRDRDRQLRAEQSIKEREKEVQLQLAGHMREREKERAHHKRDEAMRHFSALCNDLVRNADLTWKEAKKQLRKDHRWESVEQLDRDDRERIFNDHIIQLGNKKRDKFREMLAELPKFDLTVSWKDIKRQIRDDPRYLKYNSSEKCEREFREYMRDKTTEAKVAFKELLQECKLITYKSFETVKENPAHVKEIEEILKNDKRFLILDHIQHDRSQILMTYLEDLYKRGPPPPPTASESTRRK